MRVRTSKSRDQRYWSFRSTIAATWRDAVKNAAPTQIVFASLVDAISKLDVTVTDRAALNAANWASRDLVEMLHADWVLSIDGERVNGQSDRYNDPRLAGRFEWRGTGKPFYDRAEPELLNGRNGIAVRDAQEQTNA